MNPPANAGVIKEAGLILDQEDPVEENMATQSSVLAWRSHGQRSPVSYSPWGCRELAMTEAT